MSKSQLNCIWDLEIGDYSDQLDQLVQLDIE